MSGFDLGKFVESFPTLVDADGSPKKLRAIALKLGLAGRLGTNDPHEKRVEFVPRTQSAKVVTPPHDNWVACGLEDLAEIEMGNSPPGTSYNDHGSGVPLINGPVEFSSGPFGLTKKTKFTTEPARMCRRGDLLVCVRGATTGRTNIAAFEACIGRGVAAIRAKGDQHYLNYFMWSVGTDLLAAGTGTTFPAISKDDLVALTVLVPPPAEQKRIVAKVDELMRLIDDLEAKQAKKREVQTRLRASALGALAKAEGAEELGAAWKRVAGNFEVLFDKPESVEVLRRAVRDLYLSSSVSERRVVLGDLVDETRYGTARKCGRDARQTPVLRIPNVVGGRLALGDLKYTVFSAYELAELRLRAGDVLVVRSNGTRELVGRSCVVDEQAEGFAFAGYLIRLRLKADRVTPWWIHLAMQGSDIRLAIEGPARTTSGVHNINTKEILSLSLPVPPLAEQKRIVAKVDSLMKLCDDLEAKLAAKEATAGKLVEAVVRELSG